MKFKFLLLFALISNCLFSQDIKPGKTATGFSEFKGNTSVDFATGILNYNVPLFTAEYEGISIPVTLSYNAGGIKNAERPGLAGIGWTLNYGGGTISRTLRGMAADEDTEVGILDHPIPEGSIGIPAFDQHLEKVNSGKLDGESDIFTLNIQGASVKFILVKNGSVIQAKPLEKTDVSIALTFSSYPSRQISGWTITDGGGNVYEFIPAAPSNLNTIRNAPGTNYASQSTTSWFLSKIKTFDHKEISFVYDDLQYPDLEGGVSAVSVKYSPVMKQPRMDDPALIRQLNEIASYSAEASIAIAELTSQFNAAMNNARQVGQIYRQQYSTASDLDLRMNRSLMESYNTAINLYNKQIETISAFMPSEQMVSSILAQMRAPVDKDRDYFSTPTANLFVTKVLKKIILPAGEVTFNYTKSDNITPLDYYSGIEYRSNTGELLHAVKLGISRNGYLKDLKWVDEKDSLQNSLGFDYYLEDDFNANIMVSSNGTSYAADFWGYYNGQNSNSTLMPRNSSYMFFNADSPVGYSSVFFGGDADRPGLANRDPDINYSTARSLKSIKTRTGATTTLTYEGNEIYSADIDRNIPMGGLRIKSISVNDGQKNRITSYKYAFEKASGGGLMRSTGRLNEWQKKLFSWNYYFAAGGSDHYNYENFIYRGSIYDDGSNNGVLYHYVEEIKPDNAVIGYKFPEVYAGYYLVVGGILDQYHNAQLDRALLAKIYYNANGKIVQIDRKKYAYPLQYLGNRTNEYTQLQSGFPYFEDAGGIVPATFKQIKKEPVHFNDSALLESYPDRWGLPQYTIRFGTVTSSINPYYSFYAPNYPIREMHQQLATIYDILLESALLQKEEETLTFADYDLNAFNSVANPTLLPNERPYLFDRLLRYGPAKRLSSLTAYTYGANQVYVNATSARDSKNVITTVKKKYAGDYDLPSSHVISLMKQAHNLNEVIETQIWKSTDNGSSFKLAAGETNEYEQRLVNGQSYIFPIKKYKTTLPQLTDPAASGYAENYAALSGYTSQFWENKSLYSLQESYTWSVKNGFTKQVQVNDLTGAVRSAVKYSDFDGSKLMELDNVKNENVIAVDFGPAIRHAYYATTYNKFTKDKFGLMDTALNLAALSLRDYSLLLFNSAPDFTLDNYRLSVEENNVINILKTSPNYQQLIQYPLFADFLNIFSYIANGQNEQWFEVGMAKYTHDFKQAYYFSQDYFNMQKMMNASGVNSNLMVCIVNNMLNLLKFNYSQSPYYLDLKPCSYEFSKNKSFAEKLRKPYEMAIDAGVLNKRYINLYTVRKNGSTGATNYVTAIYADGSASARSTVSVTMNQKVNKLSLDLQSFANYNNIKTLRFDFDYHNIVYAAVVPDQTFFKAYAYLPDGKPYLNFDQNLKTTESFYNGLGDFHYSKNELGEVLSMQELKYATSVLPAVKTVKVNITNSYQMLSFVPPIAPKIIYLDLQSAAATGQIFRYPLDIYPGQIKTIEIPAGKYYLGLNTEVGNYTLKINNIQVTTTSMGVIRYLFDATNLKQFNIDIY